MNYWSLIMEVTVCPRGVAPTANSSKMAGFQQNSSFSQLCRGPCKLSAKMVSAMSLKGGLSDLTIVSATWETTLKKVLKKFFHSTFNF